MSDRLTALGDRVAALDHAPVAEHPEVLEEVHRGLVAELDALAGAGSATRAARR